MVLFTFPPQDYNFIGTNDWLTYLLTHEFRHVAQYAFLKQNFNQLVYWLWGDLALGAMMSLNIPAWLFEGDAVGTETALTQSGRGRIPYFSLLYKTNLLEHRAFSYAKQTLGSFRDPVPSCYEVGYYLTTHLQRKYGATVISDILQNTTMPRFFYTAVKHRTGKSLLKIYEEANQELKSLWQAQLQGLKLTPAQRLTKRRHTDCTDYTYPQLDEEGNVIALKSGIGTVTQFVRLDDQGRESLLLTPGVIKKEVGFSIGTA